MGRGNSQRKRERKEQNSLWALQTHARRRREYAALGQHPAYTHLRVVRLRSPRETERWLACFDPRGIS